MINIEKIYNTHLAISRKMLEKPFKIRKDFSNMDENKMMILKRLEILFNHNPSIDLDLFFKAPYEIWKDEKYFPLDFYLKGKAISTYIKYVKMLDFENVDSEENKLRFQKCIKHIYDFCIDKSIPLEEYIKYTEDGESLPSILLHLKGHKINYQILVLLNFKTNIEKELLDFIFGDFYLTFGKTRNKILASTSFKPYADRILKKLSNKLKQNNKLKQTENNEK